jgi:hypothetical protein
MGDTLLARGRGVRIVSRLSRVLGTAILPMAFSGACLAEQFVIAHSSVHISGEEVRDVFLGEKQFAGGVKLVPVDNASVQELFLSSVLKMSAAKYETAWIKKSFRDGLVPPSTRSGDAETIEFVRRTPGAVGYVAAPKPPTGVTVIARF